MVYPDIKKMLELADKEGVLGSNWAADKNRSKGQSLGNYNSGCSMAFTRDLISLSPEGLQDGWPDDILCEPANECRKQAEEYPPPCLSKNKPPTSYTCQTA